MNEMPALFAIFAIFFGPLRLKGFDRKVHKELRKARKGIQSQITHMP